MSNRDIAESGVSHLAPESLQGLLVGALADAGIDIIAFGSDASLAFTTLGPTQEYRDALIEYARDHRGQTSEGGRLLFTREGTRRLYRTASTQQHRTARHRLVQRRKRARRF